MMEAMTVQRRLIPVTKWNDFHVWPSPGGLRHLIFHAEANGFDRAVRRAGSRVLIDEAEFFAWLDAKGEAGRVKPAALPKRPVSPKRR